MTDPYGQHLGNGHDHREYGYSAQHATELGIRVGLRSQNVRRIVNHLAFLRIAMFRLLNHAGRQRRAVLQRDQRVLDDPTVRGKFVTIILSEAAAYAISEPKQSASPLWRVQRLRVVTR